jgi:hypothetical protein
MGSAGRSGVLNMHPGDAGAGNACRRGLAQGCLTAVADAAPEAFLWPVVLGRLSRVWPRVPSRLLNL